MFRLINIFCCFVFFVSSCQKGKVDKRIVVQNDKFLTTFQEKQMSFHVKVTPQPFHVDTIVDAWFIIIMMEEV